MLWLLLETLFYQIAFIWKLDIWLFCSNFYIEKKKLKIFQLSDLFGIAMSFERFRLAVCYPDRFLSCNKYFFQKCNYLGLFPYILLRNFTTIFYDRFWTFILCHRKNCHKLSQIRAKSYKPLIFLMYFCLFACLNR